jgi:hypothetical protein
VFLLIVIGSGCSLLNGDPPKKNTFMVKCEPHPDATMQHSVQVCALSNLAADDDESSETE